MSEPTLNRELERYTYESEEPLRRPIGQTYAREMQQPVPPVLRYHALDDRLYALVDDPNALSAMSTKDLYVLQGLLNAVTMSLHAEQGRRRPGGANPQPWEPF